MNQARTFHAETTVAQFAADTFDPVALNTSVATDNYFYQLCLQGRYTKSSWCVPLSPSRCRPRTGRSRPFAAPPSSPAAASTSSRRTMRRRSTA